MLGNLLNYGSSDDESDEDNKPQQENKNVEQESKKEEKVEENKSQLIKRKLNYSKLATLNPSKQTKTSQNAENEEDDDWDPSKIKKNQEANKDQSGKNNKGTMVGMKLFKLSKPKSELRNLGDEDMIKAQKDRGQNIQNYDTLIQEKNSKNENLKDFQKFNTINKKRQERVMGKLTEVLATEVTEKDQQKIDQYDTHDQMYINQNLLDKVGQIYDQNGEEAEEYQNSEQYQQQVKEYDDQRDEDITAMKKDIKFVNKHNKREQEFLQNMVDVDGGDLVESDWKGIQEKSATTKELIAQNQVAMPSNDKARGKNQINFLARDVITKDTASIGIPQQYQGSSQARSRKRYGW